MGNYINRDKLIIGYIDGEPISLGDKATIKLRIPTKSNPLGNIITIIGVITGGSLYYNSLTELETVNLLNNNVRINGISAQLIDDILNDK